MVELRIRFFITQRNLRQERNNLFNRIMNKHSLQEIIHTIRASRLFDEDWYKSEYHDVVILGMDPIENYIRFGERIGRQPSLDFDAKYYFSANPDVKQAGMCAFFHFVVQGRLEGRAYRRPEASAPNKASDLDDVVEEVVYVPKLEAEPLGVKSARLIAFYLPQFHPIPENDEWWGKGFTEWTNVKPAIPQFVGHYQPHEPDDYLGYYNLLDSQVRQRQVELAKLYGVGGFCFYFYWFGGKRLLEEPTRQYLADQTLDFPFCLCWANENWSRRWDGLDTELLISQKHSPEDDLAFIEHLAQYLRDTRYIRVDGKPLVIVYRPNLLPSAKETAARWRGWCRDAGIGEIYLAYTQSFESVDPALYGFDAAIEFPPNNTSPARIDHEVVPTSENFGCAIYDWRSIANRSKKYLLPDYQLFRGVCPAWDNTARRKNKSNVLLHSSPAGYQAWLFNAIRDTNRRFGPDERLVFVNAWNEWAEGAHLEPDRRYGYAYLEATRMAMVRTQVAEEGSIAPDLRNSIAIVIHAFYQDILEELIALLTQVSVVPIKLYVTCPRALESSIRQMLAQSFTEYVLLPVDNRGRDVLPFLKILPHVVSAGHEVLIKVHTKKSKHRQDGDVWRRDLYHKLLDDGAIQHALDLLAAGKGMGVIGPEGHVVPMSFYWGSNAATVERLAARMGVGREEVSELNFVAGTMFTARVLALQPLLNLSLSDADFEEEAGQVDGTLAHAIERLISVSACSVQLATVSSNESVAENYQFADRR